MKKAPHLRGFFFAVARREAGFYSRPLSLRSPPSEPALFAAGQPVDQASLSVAGGKTPWHRNLDVMWPLVAATTAEG